MSEVPQEGFQTVEFSGDVQGLYSFAQAAGLRFDSNCWFRGHREYNWKLVPDIFRPRTRPVDETRMTNEFRRRAPARYKECPTEGHESDFNWLSLMRHYGLPTRLLDWSNSILVAAYFAVAEMGNDDSAIWALSPGDLYKRSMKSEGKYILTPSSEEVHDSASIAFGSETDGEIIKHALPVEPNEIDLRMLTQQSQFTIHGSEAPLEQHVSAPRFLMKLRIPKNAREPLRLALRLLGVSRASLFPDLESLASDIVESESLPRVE